MQYLSLFTTGKIAGRQRKFFQGRIIELSTLGLGWLSNSISRLFPSGNVKNLSLRFLGFQDQPVNNEADARVMRKRLLLEAKKPRVI